MIKISEIKDLASVNPDKFLEGDSSIRDNRNIVKKALKYKPENLAYASERLKHDIKLVLFAVKNLKNYWQSWACPDYSSIYKLKSVEEIIRAGVKLDGHIYAFVTKELKNNKEICWDAIKYSKKTNVRFIKYAGREILNNKEIALFCVSQSGDTLSYFSEEIRRDREVIAAAISKTPYALYYASENLQNDEDLFCDTLFNHYDKENSFCYVGQELKNNQTLVSKYIEKHLSITSSNALEEAIKVNGSFYCLVKEHDKDLALLAMDTYPQSILYFSNELLQDREIQEKAVSIQFPYVYYFSEEMRDNKELMEKAIIRNFNSIEYLSERLLNDFSFILHLAKITPIKIEYLPFKFRKNREIVLNGMKTMGEDLNSVHSTLRNDREVVEAAISSSTPWTPLKYASNRLKNDKTLILLALENNIDNINHVPIKLKQQISKNNKYVDNLKQLMKEEEIEKLHNSLNISLSKKKLVNQIKI